MRMILFYRRESSRACRPVGRTNENLLGDNLGAVRPRNCGGGLRRSGDGDEKMVGREGGKKEAFLPFFFYKIGFLNHPYLHR